MADTKVYFKEFMESLNSSIGANVKAIPVAIILAIISYIIYKIIHGTFKRYSRKLPVEKTVVHIITIVVDVLVIFFAIMIIASALGINTSSLIAAFSIFGLAISLSVQNLMSNVANAINIYANHPFKVDDYVEINGVEGTVVKISLMFTKLRTYKNEMLFIPNSVVGSSIIKNYTHEEYRRVEYTIGVSYDNDVEKVKTALMELLNEEPLVAKSEDIVIFVNDYAASSINFTFRAYTKCNDYLKCLFSLKDHLKAKLDKHGINIPYPQLDVYLKNK